MARKETREIAVIDCETLGFKHGREPTPLLWGFYDGVEYFETERTEELADFLRYRRLIVYAHNGGKFDFCFLKPFMDVGQDILIVEGRIVKSAIGQSELRDSYSIIPQPLAAFKKSTFDYSVLEPETWRKYKSELSSYLKDDCVFLHELVTLHQQEYGRKLTLASSAFNYWKKNCGGEQPRTGLAFFNMIHPYYFGGRVECFEKGVIKTDFSVHDINSAYPAAMMNPHPWGDEFKTSSDVKPHSFVKCVGVSKGAFPLRDKSGGLSFPADNVRREYRVTGHEFLTAKELGLFKGQVLMSITMRKTITFTDYINHFFELKKEFKKTGDKGRYLLAKVHMNALYGKFAQDPRRHKNYKIVAEKEAVTYFDAGFTFEGYFGENVCVSHPVDESKWRFFNIATAASITGSVRATLLRAIHASKRPLYCDTDSIAACGFSGPVSEKLGEWSHEGDFVEASIAGKKLYAFKDAAGHYKTASKGITATAKQIKSIASGKQLTFERDAPTYSVKHGARFISRKIRMT